MSQAVHYIIVLNTRSTPTGSIGTTIELILDAAKKAGKEVKLIEVLCGKAWACFEAGDQDGYIDIIATQRRQVADQGEVIVLAQASMAGAAALCTDLPKSVLSSPSFGVATAVAAFRQQ